MSQSKPEPDPEPVPASEAEPDAGDRPPAPPRKPPGQTWQSYAEGLIARAQANGEFDNLPGAGKPLPDLDQPFDPMWWVRRYVKRENLPMATGQLDVQRRVERELETILTMPTESAVRRRVRQLNDEIGRANARQIAGPASTLAKLNEDRIVARWRAKREG